jgi:hypothetical protein
MADGGPEDRARKRAQRERVEAYRKGVQEAASGPGGVVEAPVSASVPAEVQEPAVVARAHSPTDGGADEATSDDGGPPMGDEELATPEQEALLSRWVGA